MSGLDIQDEKSEHDSPKSVAGGIYTVFFQQLIQTYGLVVKVSSRESGVGQCSNSGRGPLFVLEIRG